MISPQSHPKAPAARPPVGRVEPLNGWQVAMRRLVANIGGIVKARLIGDAVLTGLWYCLLGSFLAGLATSALLTLLVLMLGAVG